MHQNRPSLFASDFYRRQGYRRELCSEDHFTRFHRKTNRGSLAIFFAEEIAHLGASKSRAIFPGAVKIAAATAENRAILVHSGSAALKRDIWIASACTSNCEASQQVHRCSEEEKEGS